MSHELGEERNPECLKVLLTRLFIVFGRKLYSILKYSLLFLAIFLSKNLQALS